MRFNTVNGNVTFQMSNVSVQLGDFGALWHLYIGALEIILLLTYLLSTRDSPADCFIDVGDREAGGARAPLKFWKHIVRATIR